VDEQTALRAYDEETLERLVDIAETYDPYGVLQVGGFTRMVGDEAAAA
jgi:hypothetical protein